MATVIVGAGIIGTSTAYYLSQPPSSTPPSSIHLVESSPELFASASGFAAGFLARDWFSSPVASLGALSFDLHKQLAEENDGARKWGYSRSTGTSLADTSGKRGEDWLLEDTSRATSAGNHDFVPGQGPAWLTRRKGGKLDIISEDDTTAQVDPLRLSHFLLSTVLSRGVHLHQPCRPISISHTHSGALSSITLTSTSPPSSPTSPTTSTLPCTTLILASGAWTPLVHRTLFPTSPLHLPITPLAGHSLLVRSPRWTPPPPNDDARTGCHAVFATDAAHGFSPELFSRAGGDIYIAGLNDARLPLPAVAGMGRDGHEEARRVLRGAAERLLGGPVEVVREGVCWRPVGRRGPVVGRVEEEVEGGGVWVAAGHGPWGISLSLGTGKVVSEMVEGRGVSAEVGGLGV